eukprot:1215348-Rhodomonas_salina.7
MGPKFIEPPPFNLPLSYADAKATIPIIFILSSGAGLRLLRLFACSILVHHAPDAICRLEHSGIACGSAADVIRHCELTFDARSSGQTRRCRCSRSQKSKARPPSLIASLLVKVRVRSLKRSWSPRARMGGGCCSRTVISR